MTYFVYILLSEKDNKLYVGCTSNLQDRLKSHNRGQVVATKFRRPLFLLHSETFQDKAEAFNRERFLKSLWSARFKKNLVKKYKQNMSEQSDMG
jgi:putative endonuclease